MMHETIAVIIFLILFHIWLKHIPFIRYNILTIEKMIRTKLNK